MHYKQNTFNCLYIHNFTSGVLIIFIVLSFPYSMLNTGWLGTRIACPSYWIMSCCFSVEQIMVFGFGKLRQNLKFTYKNVDIEIVKQFNYLGVIFTKTCNFDVTKSIFLTKRLRQCTKFLKWEDYINYR